MSEEMKNRLSSLAKERYKISPHPSLGRQPSTETKKILSLKAKERLADKRNHPWFGRKHTEESKRKMSFAQSGNKHSCWKGGRIKMSNGYIAVYKPDHPFPNIYNRGKGYVLEHRLMMEEYIGRYLRKDEVVHHKNDIRHDNRIENLLLTSHGEHIGNHNRKRMWKKESIQKQKDKAKRMKRDVKGRFICKLS